MIRLTRRSLHALAALALAATGAAAAPAAAADAARGTQIVQLGDSYSAGNGTGTYTETDCWRSPENYGSQVARRIVAGYTNVSCSGGVVADLLEPRALGSETTKTATYTIDPAEHPDEQAEWERRARAARLCGTVTQPDFYFDLHVTSFVAAGSVATGTVGCQLMTEPQINAVDQSTDLVFVTIGGNDLGFASIVTQCMVAREPGGCETALDSATAQAPAMMERAKAAFAAVHERSGGHAQVYLLSYPFLMSTDSYGVPEAAPTYDAGRGLRDLQVYGDELQAKGIAELNGRGPDDFHYVDTVKAAWGGHAHGLDPRTVADQSNAWLVPVGAPGRQQPEWVHPTPDGWAATADALEAALTG
jgi:lysophospholipase L1-like esterase